MPRIPSKSKEGEKMNIQPIKAVNIEDLPYDYDPDKISTKTFGLKRSTKVVYHPPTYKKIVDTVELQNGKKVTFTKMYDKFGVLTEKLSYLRDSVGNWVKSKLQYFNKDGEVIKTLKGRKKYD